MNKHVWLQDLRNRQRNILFPDTVLNTGNFYRNMLAKEARFNPVQRAGLVVMSLVLICGSILILSPIFGDSETGPVKLIMTFEGLLFGLLYSLVGFRILKRAATATSASQHRRHRKDNQHPTKF
jgi:hypothetical protein